MALHGSANLPGMMAPQRTPRIGGKLAFDAGFLAQSRVPLLPCKRAVYAICVSPSNGDSDGSLWGAPLPAGVTVDIQPLAPVPMWRMLVAPRDAAGVDAAR
eukprot:2176844-Prymnesium_polylepis.1